MAKTTTPKYVVGVPGKPRGWRYANTKRDAQKILKERHANGKTEAEIMLVNLADRGIRQIDGTMGA